MKKTLRYAMLSVMALCFGTSAFAGTEVFDFSTKGLANTKPVKEVKGTDITLTFAKGTSKNDPAYYSKGLAIRVYPGNTLTISSDKKITSVKFTMGTYNTQAVLPTTGTVTVNTGTYDYAQQTWSGGTQSLELKLSPRKGTHFRYQKVEVTYEGSSTPLTYTDATIADLSALTATKENIKLNLTNAKVVYTYGKNAYVREGNKAIIFHETDLTLAVNDVLTGSVKVNFTPYNDMPEVVKNVQTDATALTVTHSSDAATPVSVTLDDVIAKQHICDLIELTDVTLVKEGTAEKPMYYMVDGGKKVLLYNSFKITMPTDLTKKYTVKGIMTLHNKAGQVLPTELTATTTGIARLQAEEAEENAPLYNMAGQRVDKSYKGIVIKKGKKYVAR